MPFTVYLDDSGTDPSQAVACATALIIPANRILALENELDKLKKREQFSDFHTSDCINKNKDSDFANWKDQKIDRVIRSMGGITREYVTQVFSFTVQKRIYETVVPEELREYAGKYHYSWALRHVLRFAQVWRHENGIAEPYEWLFDWMEKRDKTRKEVENVMEQAEEEAVSDGSAGEFEHYDFRKRGTFAGLQCADLVAWTNYNFSLHIENGTPLGRHAKQLWNSFSRKPRPHSVKMPGLEWNGAAVIKTAALRDWVKREQADGTSLLRFKAWKERKKAKLEQKNPRKLPK